MIQGSIHHENSTFHARDAGHVMARLLLAQRTRRKDRHRSLQRLFEAALAVVVAEETSSTVAEEAAGFQTIGISSGANVRRRQRDGYEIRHEMAESLRDVMEADLSDVKRIRGHNGWIENVIWTVHAESRHFPD